MRPAANTYPFQGTIFSPFVLMRRPAPSPRSAHATRFVTSNASYSLCGFTWPWIHSTSFPWSPTPLHPYAPSSGADWASGGGAGAGADCDAEPGDAGVERRWSVSEPLTVPRQV